MLRDRLGPLSAEAKHQVLADGAMGFYGLNYNVMTSSLSVVSTESLAQRLPPERSRSEA
jgi:hypothetical protein